MFGRRSFLIACGWIVAAPALAKRESPLAHPLPLQTLTEEARLGCPVLQIDGWDEPFDSEQSAGGQLWISVNQSWRTAWQ